MKRPLSSLRPRLSLLLFLGAGSVMAQDPGATDKNPNILLIVDSSGSMEYVMGSDTFPTCDPTGGSTSERSRWIDTIEVLGGTITNYRCEAIDRKSSAFISDYSLGATRPADADYRNPYHRPMSGSCAPGPGTLPTTNAFTYVDPVYTDYSTSAVCSFAQGADGLIDSLGTLARFGLMTFDTLPDQGRGHVASTPYSPSWASGVDGAFSYFMDTSYAQGAPYDCPTDSPVEVGVRNGAAPAWEGRLIHFGDPDAGATYDTTRHTRIKRVLQSSRPYGATPIAGALADAHDFLVSDDFEDPTDSLDAMYYASSTAFGPLGDAYVAEGCRHQYVIVLSDGEPNLDLRPFCENGGDDSRCPFDEPSTTADLMLADGIPTYVVGLVPDTTSGGTDCTALDESAFSGTGACVSPDPTDEELVTCCTLAEIAYKGGTEHAYFASDKSALRNQLSNLFKELLAQSGSATQPVRSPGVGLAENSGAKAYRILTSYEMTGDGLWRGTIERLRWTCEAASDTTQPDVATEQDKDVTAGDDLSFNVNRDPTNRTFVTYVPDALGGTVYTNRSIRPNLESGVDDGVSPANTGAAVSGTPSSFVSGLSGEELMPDPSGPCSALTTTGCRDLLAQWFVGLDNGSEEHRCATPATSPDDVNCSVVGDIMHSTPIIVDRPTAAVEDETYVSFAATNIGRPMMMYTASNDGVFHGFMLSPNDASDQLTLQTDTSERFAFVPPAILPTIQTQYPSSRQKLLDGFSVTLDVVATEDPLNTYYPFKLEREGSSFASTSTTWRTVVVQSFGGSNAGFYAVDVTDPDDPTFLWQLTTDENGNPMFGEQAATPLITTLNIQGDEVAVAILPGGYGSPAAGSCARGGTYTAPVGYTPRTSVRCYNLDKSNDNEGGAAAQVGDDTTYIGARSLTVVRLDSGEVIRSFRRNADEAPLLAAATAGYAGTTTGLVKEADLDSPITGTAAAYPSGPGAISDRLFIGDQDGTLWKVDFSSYDPESWSMNLFFDAFATYTGASPALDGHPVLLSPVLSIDELGQLTVAFATGDQDLSGGSSDTNYVWSLRETVRNDATGFDTTVNWYLPLTAGKHVLGPMLMLSEVLYFATYDPSTSGAACDTGESAIYGLHYTEPFDAADLSQGGQGALAVGAGASITAAGSIVTSLSATELGLPSDDTLIFGVSLEYVPTCYDTSTGASTWLGTQQNLTNMSSSNLQLTFQTGTTETSKENLGFKTGFESLALQPPRSAATVESWAPILE